ncbi:helix-turn-helix domain-containing protein [Nocardioides dubius]|uniref:Helix-turn-helix domain-containing protein n=1 Tax=Nocardioides dubius TaxID=317019 RepID=A0ABN1TV75_9ACTN
MADAERELHGIAVVMTEQGTKLTEGLVHSFRTQIPELPSDLVLVEMLEGSTGSNLEMLAHVFRGHVPMSDVQAPAAAVEYARRLAQRGTPPSALLRAYRLGQQLVLRWAGEQLTNRPIPPELALATSQLLMETSFEYIDRVSESVMGAYQDERERWLANRSAVQREMVETLLRGDRVEVVAAEAALGYRLRQQHLGLVLWASSGDSGLADAERLVARIAQRIGSTARPLYVPRDRQTAWCWLAIGRESEVDLVAIEELLRSVEGVQIAVGTPEAGESGFRATHLGAAAAHRVAGLGQHRAPVISYGEQEVRAAAMLANDLPTARRMVADTLGDLAADTRAAQRMRETLLAFVQDRESYVATAARLHLHKNTVKYRVDRALEARGKPLHAERLDLELALIGCAWLGPELLR